MDNRFLFCPILSASMGNSRIRSSEIIDSTFAIAADMGAFGICSTNFYWGFKLYSNHPCCYITVIPSGLYLKFLTQSIGLWDSRYFPSSFLGLIGNKRIRSPEAITNALAIAKTMGPFGITSQILP